MPESPVYLTTAELAARLRTTVSVLYEWRCAGKGPRAIKPGTRILYPVAEVERWVQEQLATEDERASSRRGPA